MNLDDQNHIRQLDRAGMLAEIEALPDQLEQAWELGQTLPLPQRRDFRAVIIAGMGGSAIGADLLAAYAAPFASVPLFVQRDYNLPGWARGAQTLVIASSHSGNTEETLSAFEQALERGCTCIAVSTGGKLARRAAQLGASLWKFTHQGQPRAAVGFSFGLLLAALTRLGLSPDPAEELAEALQTMRAQQEHLRVEVPTVQNPAKRQAGQLIGRWVTVVGAEVLAPVARRWKTQINELAKAWGAFESLPEADHNTLAGILNPEPLFGHAITLFLTAPSYHPRNRLRCELTRKIFMLEGLNTDVYQAHGRSRLAHMWSTLHFGDYMAYYLALAYGIDPTPVEAIESFKAELGASP